MRFVLPFLLLILIVPAPHVLKPLLTITPSGDYYFRGTTITISGKLVEPNGSPIQNATIQLLINGTKVDETTTASDGSFSFTYTIPLDRPPGHHMNITAYFPGDLLHLPSKDSEIVLIYGSIETVCTRSDGSTDKEVHFEGPTTISFEFYAVFDNGTQAPIDRYYVYLISNATGTYGEQVKLNDTSHKRVDLYIESPSSVLVNVYAYVDFYGFLFKEGTLRKTFALNFLLYEYAFVNGTLEASKAGGNAYAEVYISDEYGLIEHISDSLGTITIKLQTPKGDLEPSTIGQQILNDSIYINATFQLPSFWGGDVSIYLSYTGSWPEYVKPQRDLPKVRVPLLNVSIIGIPDRIPSGVYSYFVPYIVNELDGSKRYLHEYGSIEANASVTQYLRGFVVLSDSNVHLTAYASANSSDAYFEVSMEKIVEAVEVNIETNVSGTVRLMRNQNVIFYLEISPRDFPGVSAMAVVTIGTNSEKELFTHTLTIVVNGREILNGTRLIVKVGAWTFSALLLLKSLNEPTQPTSPTNPSAASGQARYTALIIALLIAIIVLLIYLIYLVIKRVSKRFSKPKGRVITEQEKILQRIRSLYQAGNYKLLAIEAYRLLTQLIAPMRGVVLRPNDTPRRVAEKLIAAGVRSSLVMTIVNAYEIAKYSPWDLDDETAQQLVAVVSTLVKEYLRPKPK